MTIALTGVGGLMTRLGKIGKMLLSVNTDRGTTQPANIAAINAQYLAADQNLIGNLYPALTSYQSATGSIQTYSQALAQATLLQMVNDDTPMNNPSSLNEALTILLAQWVANADYISPPTVTAGSPAYGSSDRGTGIMLATVSDAYENTTYSAFNETLSLKCTSDASTGATNFNEPFSLQSPATQPPLSWLWPSSAGSGVSITLNSVNPQTNNGQGNNLTNSDWESWTSNIPNNWALAVGTALQDFLNGGGGAAYYGSSCLQFSYYAGTPLTQITQKFGDSTNGTAYTLLPDTVYGFNIHAKKTSGLSGAGTVKIGLVDAQSLAFINDDAGNPQSFTFTCAGLSTSYASKSGYFRTPRALPANGVKLSIGLSVAIADSGQSIYLDYSACPTMTRVYAGGPLVSVISGGTPWAQGDTITEAINNNYSGAWQTMLERLFSLRSLGFQFPTTGSTLILDSLLS